MGELMTIVEKNDYLCGQYLTRYTKPPTLLFKFKKS